MNNDRFDARDVDVTKLKSITDCEIVILECAHSLKRIKSQIDEGGRDDGWKEATLRACGDYEHKMALAKLKLKSIKTSIEESKKRKEDAIAAAQVVS